MTLSLDFHPFMPNAHFLTTPTKLSVRLANQITKKINTLKSMRGLLDCEQTSFKLREKISFGLIQIKWEIAFFT